MTPPPPFPLKAFGAIAYSQSTRRFGSSWAWISRPEAERVALQNCGATDRVVAISGFGTWIALAVDDSGAWGSGYGTEQRLAEQGAQASCRQVASGPCRIAVAFHTSVGL